MMKNYIKKLWLRIRYPITQERYLWMNSYNINTYIGTDRISSFCWQSEPPSKDEINKMLLKNRAKAIRIRNSIY